MEISIAAEKLFTLGMLPVTNALLIGALVSVFLIGLTRKVLSSWQEVPRGAQNLLEVAVDGVVDMLDGIMQDRALSKRFFPLIATIFLFILFSNWAGLLPGLGTVGLSHENAAGHATIIPFLRSTSADLNFTLGLSLAVVIAIQVTGILALGVRGYAAKFFIAPWHKPYGIGTMLGLLELVSEFAKILSFAFRLFGNVFAGEILLTVMLHLAPYIVPLPFLALEIFVGFIQAAVFAMLTAVFLKMATVPAEH